jgi:hypothetical protein
MTHFLPYVFHTLPVGTVSRQRQMNKTGSERYKCPGTFVWVQSSNTMLAKQSHREVSRIKEGNRTTTPDKAQQGSMANSNIRKGAESQLLMQSI